MFKAIVFVAFLALIAASPAPAPKPSGVLAAYGAAPVVGVPLAYSAGLAGPVVSPYSAPVLSAYSAPVVSAYSSPLVGHAPLAYSAYSGVSPLSYSAPLVYG